MSLALAMEIDAVPTHHDYVLPGLFLRLLPISALQLIFPLSAYLQT